MSGILAHIRRHPVKSLGGEALDRITLNPHEMLPKDRIWAVLHEAAIRHLGEDTETSVLARWLPKSAFLRGVAAPALQAIEGGIGDDGQITLRHPERPVLRFDPETGGAALLDWLRPLWPADQPAPLRLVTAPVALSDVNKPWVSVLSLDSLRDLEHRVGLRIGHDRWRGNLWVKGWQPQEERDLIDREIRIGGARLRIAQPITRCAATSADPRSGKLDIDMPVALEQQFGHRDFGVYAEVIEGAEVKLGDKVDIL